MLAKAISRMKKCTGKCDVSTHWSQDVLDPMFARCSKDSLHLIKSDSTEDAADVPLRLTLYEIHIQYHNCFSNICTYEIV